MAAIPFERVVKEDINRGYGTVSVTMPGGGSATGTKIGLHTWTGVVNVMDFGATGDGVTNDSAAIQAALNTGFWVYFPPGDYSIGSTTLVPVAGQKIFGAGIGSALTFRSRILYSGTGSAFLDTHAINSSGRAEVTFEDIYILGSGGASTGAGIELLAGGFAFYVINRCRIGGTFKYGVIADGIEVSRITNNIFENGLGLAGSCHLWIVNGDDRRAGQAVGFSNVIAIEDNQFNGAAYGLIDDGGDGHRVVGNNFNGHSVSMQFAGLTNFLIDQNDCENAGIVTGIANILCQDRSGVGGGSINPDKAPCRGGRIMANSLQQDMIAGSSTLVKFTATTAGAYHKGIMGMGNICGNRLGRSAAWDVTRLGRSSFIGFNNDDSTTTAHFTGVHNDAEAPTLFLPGGSTDSLAGSSGVLNLELTGTKTWTPTAGLADGAISTTDVTVTGARVVDVCTASHDGIGANNVTVNAICTANDTVRVILTNRTGAPISIPSGISRVIVKKPTV